MAIFSPIIASTASTIPSIKTIMLAFYSRMGEGYGDPSVYGTGPSKSRVSAYALC